MTPVSKQGFTLIELLVVITIIGLLLVVLLPSYSILGAKTRLQNSADTLTQMIEQARTFAVSGYKNMYDDPHLVAVGVTLEKGKNTFTMFSCPLVEDLSVPCDIAASQEIKQEHTQDIILRSLYDSYHPELSFERADIIFIPPFGDAIILIPSHPMVTNITIEIGLGITENRMKKILEFTTTTNRINYDP